MTIHEGYRGVRPSEFRSPADEVDDFQAISVVQWSLRPLVAGDDLAIQFDGYAVGLHAERFDEGAQGFGGRGLGFAIDCQVH